MRTIPAPLLAPLAALFVCFPAMNTSAHADEAPLPRPARAITIMPLGDSITEGGAGFKVYRYPLMEKLVTAGYNVTCVGSSQTRPVANSPLGVLSHEGHGGWNVGALAGKFPEYFAAHPADILLVHAGHNQYAALNPVPGMLASTRKIVMTAREINPKVIILLAQVIPSGKLPKYSYIPEFNKALVPLAAELHKPEQPLILVNQEQGFDVETDTVGDKVHPSASGAEKMANRWYDALIKVLPAPAAAATIPGKP